jgi:hypothetical protein
MRGAIPPLPQYTFMALCSVKAQGHLYFYFYISPVHILCQPWDFARLGGFGHDHGCVKSKYFAYWTEDAIIWLERSLRCEIFIWKHFN